MRQMEQNWKTYLKKAWHFIWEEDSILSWLVNIVLAFILIKFIVYPGLGLLFGTNFPVVAVVSSSMEHQGNFDSWWEKQGTFYAQHGMFKNDFQSLPFSNGFNKGDIMVVVGSKPQNITRGMVIVFWSGKSEPIIHRVVDKDKKKGIYTFQTKGDNNPNQIQTSWLDEKNIEENKVIGKAVLRIPFLGWVKILFVELLQVLGLMPQVI